MTKEATNYTLGISCFYHDSAVAITKGGEIIGALQEERISRKKNDDRFPTESIVLLMKEHDLGPEDFGQVAYYEKPFLTFERLLETYHAYAPKGFLSYLKVMPLWIKEKVFMKSIIKKELKLLGFKDYQLFFPSHHHSHLGAAFYPSPFSEAAIMTIDGVGEWDTLSLAYGKEDKITPLATQHFPHSLGLFYSAFTYFCGFKVNEGEYKLMGLAPYAHRENQLVEKYQQVIEENLIDIREDGSFLLNQKYFSYATAFTMVPDSLWQDLFNLKKRVPEETISREHAALALACQKVTEKIIMKLAHTLYGQTRSDHLCLAGGVALNSVDNGLLVREGPFKKVWIQPASGDAGSSLGAALVVDNSLFPNSCKAHHQNVSWPNDLMKGSLLGPSYSSKAIEQTLISSDNSKFSFEEIKTEEELLKRAAQDIANEQVIGWFQGRLEFGPRALGSRSILADARSRKMQQLVNLKIKFREGFRPFAPAVLEEDFKEIYSAPFASPYMQTVHPIKDFKPQVHEELPIKSSMPSFIQGQLKKSHPLLPAVTHVDGSARVQVVSKSHHPLFEKLIREFKEISGVGLLLNTSFNVRGEPIVMNPENALDCFLKTEMDVLYLGVYRVLKNKNH
jgi:carbamoyltransferase